MSDSSINAFKIKATFWWEDAQYTGSVTHEIDRLTHPSLKTGRAIMNWYKRHVQKTFPFTIVRTHISVTPAGG